MDGDARVAEHHRTSRFIIGNSVVRLGMTRSRTSLRSARRATHSYIEETDCKHCRLRSHRREFRCGQWGILSRAIPIEFLSRLFFGGGDTAGGFIAARRFECSPPAATFSRLVAIANVTTQRVMCKAGSALGEGAAQPLWKALRRIHRILI